MILIEDNFFFYNFIDINFYVGSRAYAYKVNLDIGMVFYWNPANTNSSVFEFAFSAPTLGWVGIGKILFSYQLIAFLLSRTSLFFYFLSNFSRIS